MPAFVSCTPQGLPWVNLRNGIAGMMSMLTWGIKLQADSYFPLSLLKMLFIVLDLAVGDKNPT